MSTARTPKWLHRFSICVYAEGTSLTVQTRDTSTLAFALGKYVPSALRANEEGVWYEADGEWKRERALRTSAASARAMRSIYREWIMQDISKSPGGVALREQLIQSFEDRRGGNMDTCARLFARHLAVLIRLGLVIRTMLPNGRAEYRIVMVPRGTSPSGS